MFNVDTTRLNPAERRIVDGLVKHAKSNPPFKIKAAAELCGCSISQVSKAVKKAGFSGYKDFIHILYTGERPPAPAPDELDRLKRVIDDFDLATVAEFVSLLAEHERIVFFGYGPSLIGAQYFEYKPRFCSNAFVTTAPDEQSAKSMLEQASLLVIFTTTGQYRSFKGLAGEAKRKGAAVVVVSEEFNPLLLEICHRYIVLTRHKQSDTLAPHEKTRTVFFIFFEQVIQKIHRDQAHSQT
ncbi:MAG: MurR/RpiR family transcriptional regulator [Anaerolineales bacterium]|nr:MurR/RpiR family transcriptional regulator [Anaerolineales bacterium]